MGILTRQLEKRVHPSNNNFNWASLFGSGTLSTAGSVVNESTAMGVPAVWAAVNFYATVIGSLPRHTYKVIAEGKEKAVNHHTYPIFHSVTNPMLVAMTYVENVIWNILLMGISYSETVRDGRGFITEVWPLPTYRVEEIKSNGTVVYKISLPNGGYRYLRQDQVIKVLGAYGGTSILGMLKESLGLTISLNEFAARFFGAGANPGTIVTHPGNLGETAHKKLKNSLVDKYSGLGKSHRLLLLDEGMAITKVGNTPEESQAIESRVFQINEVARIFNLPPHILKELTKSSFNNIEQQSLETVIFSLGPMCVRLEQHWNAQVLTPKERKKYFIKNNLEGLLRGDIKTRTEFYWKMFQMAGVSTNDILEKEDQNTIGPLGDQRFVTAQMVTLENAKNLSGDSNSNQNNQNQPNQQNSLPEVEEKRQLEELRLHEDRAIKNLYEIKDTFLPLIEDIAQSVINKETLAITRGVKKFFPEKKSENRKTQKDFFNDWLDNFYEKFQSEVEEKFKPVISAYARALHVEASNLIKVDPKIGPDVEKFVFDYIARYAERHIGKSQGQIESIVKDAKPELISEEVTKRMSEWHETRASKIAYDEAVRGQNAFSLETWVANGVVKKEWVTRGTNCPFCDTLKGKIVGVKKNFLEKNEEIKAPVFVVEDGEPRQTWGTMRIYSPKGHAPIHEK